MPPPWEDPYWARPNAREKRARSEMKAEAFRQTISGRERGPWTRFVTFLRRLRATAEALWKRL